MEVLLLYSYDINGIMTFRIKSVFFFWRLRARFDNTLYLSFLEQLCLVADITIIIIEKAVGWVLDPTFQNDLNRPAITSESFSERKLLIRKRLVLDIGATTLFELRIQIIRKTGSGSISKDRKRSYSSWKNCYQMSSSSIFTD